MATTNRNDILINELQDSKVKPCFVIAIIIGVASIFIHGAILALEPKGFAVIHVPTGLIYVAYTVVGWLSLTEAKRRFPNQSVLLLIAVMNGLLFISSMLITHLMGKIVYALISKYSAFENCPRCYSWFVCELILFALSFASVINFAVVTYHSVNRMYEVSTVESSGEIKKDNGGDEPDVQLAKED